MNRSAIIHSLDQRSLAIGLLLVGILGLAACQPAADLAVTGVLSEQAEPPESDPVDEAAEDVLETEEVPTVRIELGEWRSDLPPNTSLIVPGGSFNSHGFPALSADSSEIAILYFAGHPMLGGYPTFELHSTATLELLERIDLFSEQEQDQVIQATGRAPNRRDPQLLRRIEAMLGEINSRLEQGRFRPMETLFKLEQHRIDGLETFGKRIDYPSKDTGRALAITSLSTGQLELEMELPTGVETYEDFPDMGCGWGGLPRQAWYDPELGIMVLRLTFSTSRDGCEQPEQWFFKRLEVP